MKKIYISSTCFTVKRREYKEQL